MRILNKTKNTILAEQAIIASSLLKRMKGLLGRKELKQKEALIIKPCNSIHTFFMHFPIDALFVDRHSKVIKTISALQPGRLTWIYFNAAFAIELPLGTIQSSFTSQDDLITIE